MRLAIFLPNWVGDAVMATAALRAIRADFPTAHVVGIARPVIAETLADSGLLDHVLLFHPRGKNPAHTGQKFLSLLRQQHCETALLLTNSLRTAWLAWRSNASRRIGFRRDLRGWLLTEGLAPFSRSTPNPVIDEYLRLARQLGCTSLSRQMQLAVSPQAREAWRSFEQRNAAAQLGPDFVALNSGGAFGPAKNWPKASFVELAQRIHDELGRAVVVLCGPAERDDAAEIARQAARPRVVTIADEPLSISLTKAAISSAGLLVTTDSGPRHFASAFNVPAVTLFGPTHVAWSETFHPLAEHVQLKIDCGPCQQRACPLKHHRCMTELSVARVFEAVVRGMASRQQRQGLAG